MHEVVPATLRATDNDGSTPAHKAADCGHLEVVQFLHEVVPDTLRAEDNDGRTPAQWATMGGHQAVADYLAKPWTPLMHAAADRRPQDVERLLHHGADPTVAATQEGRTNTALTLRCAAPRWSSSKTR